jgi:Ca2+-binding RTX toxin-like protein
MRKSFIVPCAVAVAAAGAGLWQPASAASQQGATAYTTFSDNREQAIYYRAGDGEANVVTLSRGPDSREVIIDDEVPIEAGEGCTHPDETDLTRVVCAYPDGWGPYVDSDLGDGNDQLDATELRYSIWASGRAGDDTIIAAGVAGTLWGGEGDDTLTGADYQYGEAGDDTLTGTKGDDYFYAAEGDDVIRGQGGNDEVNGEEGRDEIRGGDGNDELRGGPDADTIFGGNGDDQLYGGAALDHLDGGPGNDEEHQD